MWRRYTLIGGIKLRLPSVNCSKFTFINRIRKFTTYVKVNYTETRE